MSRSEPSPSLKRYFVNSLLPSAWLENTQVVSVELLTFVYIQSYANEPIQNHAKTLKVNELRQKKLSSTSTLYLRSFWEGWRSRTNGTSTPESDLCDDFRFTR